MTLPKTALAAAIAQLFLGLLQSFPRVLGVGPALNWKGLSDSFVTGIWLYECAALSIFLLVVFRWAESLNFSAQMRLAALVAATALGLENVRRVYGTARNALSASISLEGWGDHLLGNLRYVLVPTIPSIAVVSLIAFLIALYRFSPEKPKGEAPSLPQAGLRNAALLALSGTLVALGMLAYEVAANFFPLTWDYSVRLALRLTSLFSLGLFFLLCMRSRARAES